MPAAENATPDALLCKPRQVAGVPPGLPGPGNLTLTSKEAICSSNAHKAASTPTTAPAPVARARALRGRRI